ncbi:MAG: prolyl oligopeptidase family serine peptidase [Candidatus Nitrosopolaris sp.]
MFESYFTNISTQKLVLNRTRNFESYEATSILIPNGENDIQTLVQQSFLLQQRLTELNHPDHTLIIYPNLGHLFYPSSQWRTDIGPIQEYVLADLYAWLERHIVNQ